MLSIVRLLIDMSNRSDMLLPPGFLGVEVELLVRGKAFPMSVEKESTIMRLALESG